MFSYFDQLLIFKTFSLQQIFQQRVTAQLPNTFYSGPFVKQSVNAVSTELVQQQLLLPQQPPQLQLVNTSEQPSPGSTT